MSLFQSNLRKQIRKLPKFLKFVKNIQYYSISFIRVPSLAEDPQRLLQAADLLFAPRRPLLPRHAGVHAHGLELLELVQRVLEDFLLGPKVSLSLSQTAPFIIS